MSRRHHLGECRGDAVADAGQGDQSLPALLRENVLHRAFQRLDDLGAVPPGGDPETIGALLGQEVRKLAQPGGEVGILRAREFRTHDENLG